MEKRRSFRPPLAAVHLPLVLFKELDFGFGQRGYLHFGCRDDPRLIEPFRLCRNHTMLVHFVTHYEHPFPAQLQRHGLGFLSSRERAVMFSLLVVGLVSMKPALGHSPSSFFRASSAVILVGTSSFKVSSPAWNSRAWILPGW